MRFLKRKTFKKHILLLSISGGSNYRAYDEKASPSFDCEDDESLDLKEMAKSPTQVFAASEGQLGITLPLKPPKNQQAELSEDEDTLESCSEDDDFEESAEPIQIRRPQQVRLNFSKVTLAEFIYDFTTTYSNMSLTM